MRHDSFAGLPTPSIEQTAAAGAAAAALGAVVTGGVGAGVHVDAVARATGNQDRRSPSTVCDVANVLTPNESLGLSTLPTSVPLVICCERSQASGLVYAV